MESSPARIPAARPKPDARSFIDATAAGPSAPTHQIGGQATSWEPDRARGGKAQFLCTPARCPAWRTWIKQPLLARLCHGFVKQMGWKPHS
jgi:hypothetical protein